MREYVIKALRGSWANRIWGPSQRFGINNAFMTNFVIRLQSTFLQLSSAPATALSQPGTLKPTW